MKLGLYLAGILMMSTHGLAGGDVNLGAIRGTVVAEDSGGTISAVPGALVKLHGSGTFEVRSDDAGNYQVVEAPSGFYTIAASAPGLVGTATITVVAGEVVDARIELKIESVKVSVTVSDDAQEVVSSIASGREVLSARNMQNTPNNNERLDSALPLIPGVIRGPDGAINFKGARSSQNGALLNGADVSDPVTGVSAIRLPLEAVSSVQVISNPYDPAYGRMTGAVASVETRTGNYETFHASVQNLLPRPRKRDGDIVGVENYQPRMTITGPLLKDRVAFTQSLEYRYTRTPISSLPQLQRDTKLESFDSLSQIDWAINSKQSATISFAVYPQKLDYIGLNTFTPQSATPDLHQRGYLASMQHRYVTGSESMLISQLNFKRQDADVFGQSTEPYRLLVETTQGGFFNRQNRETYRNEWQETYHFGKKQLLGSHQIKAGFNYAYTSYDGRMSFSPIEIAGANGSILQRTQFSPQSIFNVNEHETSAFIADKWIVHPRLTVDYGVRMDRDSVTHTTNAAPRAGLAYTVTNDGKTVLRAGSGIFYDRVTLNVASFPLFPTRTTSILNAVGEPLISTHYSNVLEPGIQNPRSIAWNTELDRQLLDRFWLRVGFEQRNTSRDFVITPFRLNQTDGVLSASNSGRSVYREFQITGRYQFKKSLLNASYVRSKAYGDLNDFNQFFGNNPQAVIQPNSRARLPFDAPNRFVIWGEFTTPGKFILAPLWDIRTGFPYSVQNQDRVFVGPRNAQRFEAYSSVDLQVSRVIRTPILGKARVGVSVFNILNHYNPRDVQNITESQRFGQFFNTFGRTFRGIYVVGF